MCPKLFVIHAGGYGKGRMMQRGCKATPTLSPGRIQAEGGVVFRYYYVIVDRDRIESRTRVGGMTFCKETYRTHLIKTAATQKRGAKAKGKSIDA